MNSIVSAEDLLGCTARRYKKIKVPDGFRLQGESFLIQSLSDDEQSGFEAETMGKKGHNVARLIDAKRRLVALCLVDADHKRLFTEEQISELGEVDGALLEFLQKEIAAHIGYDSEAIQSLVKNSDPTPSAASSTP